MKLAIVCDTHTPLAFTSWVISPAPALITHQHVTANTAFQIPVAFPNSTLLLAGQNQLQMIIPVHSVCCWGHSHGYNCPSSHLYSASHLSEPRQRLAVSNICLGFAIWSSVPLFFPTTIQGRLLPLFTFKCSWPGLHWQPDAFHKYP